jgi:excisionase family DNA binding protein
VQYLTIDEAAVRIGVSKRFLEGEIAAGKIDAHKLGPHRNSPVRISEAAIDAYMRAHTMAPAEAVS